MAYFLAFLTVAFAARSAFKATEPVVPIVDREQEFLDHIAGHREQSHVWLTSMLYALVLALAVAVGRDVAVVTIDSGKHNLAVHVSLLVALGVVFAEVILIYSEVMFGVRLLRGIAGAAEVVLPALVGVAQAAQVELIDVAVGGHSDSSTNLEPAFWLLGFGAFGLLASLTITLMKRAIMSSSLPSWTSGALDAYSRGLVVDRRFAMGVGAGALLVTGLFSQWRSAYGLVIASSTLLVILSITVRAQACRRHAVLRQLKIDAAKHKRRRVK